MAEVTDTTLKEYYENGDVPVEDQYVDLIDSKVNKPDLASTAAGNGASLIGIEDSVGNFTAETVEGALAEFSSTAAGDGAELVANSIRVYNVASFGAGPDVDATTNNFRIQAILDQIETEALYGTTDWASIQASALFFPEGVFEITGLVTNVPMLVFGVSKTSSVVYATTDNPAFTVRGHLTATYPTEVEDQKTTFMNLGITGSMGSGYDVPVTFGSQHGIFVDSVSTGRKLTRVEVINCAIRHCGGHGFYSEKAVSNRILWSNIDLNAKDGINLGGAYNTEVQIFGNAIRRNRRGIYIQPDAGEYITTGIINQNLIESNRNGTGNLGSATRPGVGIQLLRAQNLKVKNNYFESHLNDIYIEADSSFNRFESNYHDSNSVNIPIARDRRTSAYYIGPDDIGTSAGNVIRRNVIYKPIKPASMAEEIWAPALDTFVDGDVTPATDKITLTGHGISDDTKVQLTTTGTLPAGLALATGYYTLSVDANTITLHSATPAAAGNIVDITAAAGGGTHTLTQTEFEHIYLGDAVGATASYTQVVENYYRHVTTGSPDVITVLGGSKTLLVQTYNNSDNYMDQLTQSQQLTREASISISDKTLRTHYMEGTYTGASIDNVPVTSYIHQVGLTYAPFKRLFGNQERAADGSLSALNYAYGINGDGEFATPFDKGVAYQYATGADSFITHKVGHASPSTNNSTVGDIVWNRTNSVVLGWKCTVSGTPDTWEEMNVVFTP